jgi:hypothetical protein
MNISYYEQLEPLISSLVRNYKIDFKEYDRQELDGYHGSFIHGVRSHGTNLLLLEPESLLRYGMPVFNPHGLKASVDCLTASVNAFLFSNDYFFIGDRGVVSSVPKAKAIAYFESWMAEIKAIYALNDKAV